MSFLSLNGFPVSIASCSEAVEETGYRSKAFNGTPVTDIRSTKRIWNLKTIPLTRHDADVLSAIIRGDGDRLSWDNYENISSTPVYWTDKGVIIDPTNGGDYPINSTNWRGVLESDQTTYDRHYSMSLDSRNTKWLGYGNNITRCVSPVSGKNNLFDADVRDCENAPTGFTAIATCAIDANTDTKYIWQGSKSLKVTRSAAGDGFYTAGYNPTAGGTSGVHTASMYVKVAGITATADLTIYLRDVTNATDGSSLVKTISAADGWVRLSVFHTPGGGCTDLRLYLTIGTGSSVIYVDSLQLENWGWSSRWNDGSVVTTPQHHFLDSTIIDIEKDFTVNVWARGIKTASCQSSISYPQYLFYGYNSANPSLYPIVSLQRSATTTIVSGINNGIAGSPDAMNPSTSASHTFNDDWHMYTMVFQFRSYQDTAKSRIDLYIDGVIAGTYSIATSWAAESRTMPEYSIDTLRIGPWIDKVDDMMILPYAIGSDHVAGLYSIMSTAGSDIPLPRMPKLYITGDAVKYTGTVIGKVNNSTNIQAMNSNVWTNNMRVLDFTLFEV